MSDVRRTGDGITVSLSTADRTILMLLAQQVTTLLTPDGEAAEQDPLAELVGMSDAPVAVPTDPAVRRLLPDAYGEDEAAAHEFRRLMDGDLRREKTAALSRLLTDTSALDDTNGSLRLDGEGAELWLSALNDIRLVLGVRLDVTEDMAEMVRELAPDDPRVPLLLAYERLTWLQDSLLDAIDG